MLKSKFKELDGNGDIHILWNRLGYYAKQYVGDFTFLWVTPQSECKPVKAHNQARIWKAFYISTFYFIVSTTELKHSFCYLP